MKYTEFLFFKKYIFISAGISEDQDIKDFFFKECVFECLASLPLANEKLHQASMNLALTLSFKEVR